VPVTQQRIADELGVSVSLVSRALGGRAAAIGVPAPTIERIQQAARRMGYVPSAAARTLRGAATRTLGVVVMDLTDPFFGPVLGALHGLAHRYDYSLVLVGFERRRIRAEDVRPLTKHRIDGLLILGSGPYPLADTPLRAPAVRVGLAAGAEPATGFWVDEAAAMRSVAEHLWRLGRRRMVYVGGPDATHRRRGEELRRALAAAGRSDGLRRLLFTEEPAATAGLELGRRLLRNPDGVDAVVAANDLIALGVLRALTAAGRDIPGEIALTGFDDLPLAALTTPALTTVRPPYESLMTAAFDRLRRDLGQGAAASPVAPPRFVARLIARESA